jgi:hypothetical protein
LSSEEKRIISQAKLIFENGEISMYELPINAFDAPFDSLRKEFFVKRNSLKEIAKGSFVDSSVRYLWQKRYFFNDSASFFGDAPRYDSTTIELMQAPLTDSSSMTFEASVWVKVFTNTYETPVFIGRQEDINGIVIEEKKVSLIANVDNYEHWIRASCSFEVKSQAKTLRYYLKGRYIQADRFQLRPIESNVYSDVKEDSSFVLNNYFIPAPSH